MKIVEVKRISYYPPSKGYAVLLKEAEGERHLPIIVGSSEAQAIALSLEGVNMPRPMTHDLLVNILEHLDCEITRVIIANIKNGTFFAEIEISHPQIGEMSVDSRPSDAIAVALRNMAPIYVNDDVMESASVSEISSEEEVNQALTSAGVVEESSEEGVLENLTEALEKAVADEEYEVAARLRDRIKQLEKKLSS